MCPDDGRIWMFPEERFEFIEVGGLRFFFGERYADVAVKQDNEASFRRKFEDTIERRVLQASNFARNLGRNKLLMNRELTDASEHAWIGLQYSTDVICSVHVRWIETGDHRIESRLLFFRQ